MIKIINPRGVIRGAFSLPQLKYFQKKYAENSVHLFSSPWPIMKHGWIKIDPSSKNMP